MGKVGRVQSDHIIQKISHNIRTTPEGWQAQRRARSNISTRRKTTKQSDYTIQQEGEFGGVQSDHDSQEDGHKLADYALQKAQHRRRRAVHLQPGQDDCHKQVDYIIQKDDGPAACSRTTARRNQLSGYTIHQDGKDGGAMSNYNIHACRRQPHAVAL